MEQKFKIELISKSSSIVLKKILAKNVFEKDEILKQFNCFASVISGFNLVKITNI